MPEITKENGVLAANELPINVNTAFTQPWGILIKLDTGSVVLCAHKINYEQAIDCSSTDDKEHVTASGIVRASGKSIRR